MSDEPNKVADDVDAEGAALVEQQAESPEVSEAVSPEASIATEPAAEPAAVEDPELGSATEAADAPSEEELVAAGEDEPAEVEVAEDEAGSDEAGDVEAGDDEAESEDAAEEEDEEVAEEDVAEDEAAEEAAVADEEVDEEVDEADSDEITMDWYILKVQSNREKSIAANLQRKIAVEGLDEYFGEVVVPVEKVTEFKGGKKKVVNRKLYPGYIVVNMHINDDTWFAVRETSGIGDFTGSGGKPTPMLPHEVARIIHTEEEETEDAPKLNIAFKIGDRVKVNDGNFESFEGDVNAIDEHSGRITVMINIFGRSTPVELEYWQVELT